jgi:glyoxylase-like metal-dependent hydrolase (beta-lactamase superfamily II)/ferredoxin
MVFSPSLVAPARLPSYFAGMAHPSRRRAENVAGDFYVDDTCIDCDTCRWLAPETFFAKGGQSAVRSQPQAPEARRRALEALVACPTASIGTAAPAPEMPAVRASFPLLISGDVYYCGYHSEKSFGAASYLIRRPDGNVLVDSPRASPVLAAALERLGGVRWLFLTHGDDVADHESWRERFGCERVLHEGDLAPGTRGVERILRGGEESELAPDLRIVPVPGHTEGSCVLLYRDAFLFTGDHLAFSPRLGHLYAFRDACWYSWEEQERSMEKLRALAFEWVLPGHGRRLQTGREAMRGQLEDCIAWMKSGRDARGD